MSGGILHQLLDHGIWQLHKGDGKWNEIWEARYQTSGTQEHTYLNVFTFQVISWTELSQTFTLYIHVFIQMDTGLL